MDTNEEVMAVDKRLARLEETVAKGFFEQGRCLTKIEGHLSKIDGSLGKIDSHLRAHTGRFDRLEDRMLALESKVDVVADHKVDPRGARGRPAAATDGFWLR
ncbi:MAG: hypothetical protein ABI665_06185 [Vicinamibacterales bacterium]